MNTPFTHSTLGRENDFGTSRLALEWIRLQLGMPDACTSDPLMVSCIACGLRMDNSHGDFWPQRRIDV